MSEKTDKNQQERTKKKKVIFLDAMAKSLGVVHTACKLIDMNRSTYYDWMESDQEFNEAVKDIDNITLDFAESKLFEQMKKGNVTALIFYLKTKGKRRGYIEKMEFGHSGSLGLNLVFNEGEVKEIENDLESEC